MMVIRSMVMGALFGVSGRRDGRVLCLLGLPKVLASTSRTKYG